MGKCWKQSSDKSPLPEQFVTDTADSTIHKRESQRHIKQELLFQGYISLLAQQLSHVAGLRFFSELQDSSASASFSISEYDLVSAYEVDHNGDYVSHDIMHHQRRRQRRAASQPGGDALHLRLKGPRHDLHLDLRAASNLVAPGFMVQTLGKGGTTSVQVLPPEEFCFYQGSLRSQGNSSVALSTCQGLVSMHSCPRGVKYQWGRKRRSKTRNPGNIFTCSVTPGDIFVVCDSR